MPELLSEPGSWAEVTPAPPRDRRLRMLLRAARLIRTGTLTLVLPDGTTHRVIGGAPGPVATFIVRDPRAIRRLITGGNLGLASSYLDGFWDSPDIRQVLALGTANEAEWKRLLAGNFFARAVARALHALRPNTRGGARRNIVEHYDLGNNFFQAWLDPSMTYSSALFADPSDSLELAQTRKMRALADQLDLKPGMRLLEIGCGWGGFAEMAARDYGCKVVAITLSPSQRAYAEQRIAAAGLSDRVEIRQQDYRDVPETFERIASVEMFEAVGEKYWPTFFATLRDRLAPGGRAALQTITIADWIFPDYRRSPDFIQRHIFPGGMLPSPSALRREAGRAGLAWVSDHWFGADYAETLARWYASFQAAWPRLASGERGERFKRLWDYYLCYCESGFRAGFTDVGQILLARPS
jgi:cyclopropane-fatty-acyl-phospholipid synthase